MRSARIATVVLAAGSSSRMEDGHKLLETVGDRAVVAWAVEAALRSKADPVVLVTGHRRSDVEGAAPTGADSVYNPHYAEGLSSSLRVGLDALPRDIAAAAIALGDMPCVVVEHYEALFRAWTPGAIVVPTWHGHRGNPVLWSTEFFREMSSLQGDRGARSLLDEHHEAVREVAVRDDGVLFDVDDLHDLHRARRRVARRASSA